MIQLTTLDCFTFGISVYVAIESIAAVCRMPEGYRMFFHKIKYVLAFASSTALAYYATFTANLAFQWLLFGLAGTLATFVAPRMAWRINKLFDDLLMVGVQDEEDNW